MAAIILFHSQLVSVAAVYYGCFISVSLLFYSVISKCLLFLLLFSYD